MNAVVIFLEGEFDTKNNNESRRDANERAIAHHRGDADGLFESSAEERGETGHEGDEIEAAGGGGAGIGWNDFVGRGHQVSDGKSATKTAAERGEFREEKRIGMADEMDAGSNDEKTAGDDPKASGFCATTKPVCERAAGKKADECGALQVGGGGEAGLGEAEPEFFEEEGREPGIEQPEDKIKCGENNTNKKITWNSNQGCHGEATAGLFCFDSGILARSGKE